MVYRALKASFERLRTWKTPASLLFVGLALAGCGLFRFQQRDPWRAQAEEACLARKLITPSVALEPMHPIDGPGICGMEHPFRVSAFSEGKVGLTSRAVLACPGIAKIDTWLEEVVQPAAALYFGSSVATLRVGSYACRSMDNQPGASISEHSFGNAIDIMAFKLADGREIVVETGWRGAIEEQDFLREVFIGACRHFTTVLAPGSDVFHYNHIHMDLARHASGRRICKPLIKFTPRLNLDGAIATATPVRPLPNSAPIPADAEFNPQQMPEPRALKPSAPPSSLESEPLSLHEMEPLDESNEPETTDTILPPARPRL